MKLKELAELISTNARICIFNADRQIVKRIDNVQNLKMYSINSVCCSDLTVCYVLAYKKDCNGVKRLDVWCE